MLSHPDSKAPDGEYSFVDANGKPHIFRAARGQQYRLWVDSPLKNEETGNDQVNRDTCRFSQGFTLYDVRRYAFEGHCSPLEASVRLPLLALIDGCPAVHLSWAQRSVVSEIPRKGLL